MANIAQDGEQYTGLTPRTKYPPSLQTGINTGVLELLNEQLAQCKLVRFGQLSSNREGTLSYL
jgi:hypothetical protein